MEQEKAGFTFNSFATSSQGDKFIEAFKGFDAEWEAQGYRVVNPQEVVALLSGRRLYPKAWHVEGPQLSIIGPPNFFQFIAFLKEPATTAVLEVILGGILHSALQRYKDFFTKRSERHGELRLPAKFCPAIWFEIEQVLVTVMADINSPEDFRTAEKLVPQAFQQAVHWLETHGVTHPYLTYRIRNGMLGHIPTLSAEEPPTV